MKAMNLFVQPRPRLSEAIEGAIKSGELHARPKRLESGEYLFHSGDVVTTTHYIWRGIVKLTSTRRNGASKTVFFHEAGTLVGFQQLQDNADEKASILDAMAASTCELYELDAREFGQYLIAHGDVCHEMLCFVFDMMSRQTSEAANMAEYSTLERFAGLLLIIARDLRLTQSPALVPFHNADLAEMLGVHVNSITNCVRSLQNSACIERQHGFIAILDFKKLKSIAGDLLD
jgi:CRP/FNR family cyclic AMP-dependent transcriptional regulator